MSKIAMAIHGGASNDYDFLREHIKEHEDGLKAAIEVGYSILQQGGTAIDAVEAATRNLEDNPIFNAGKGSALNSVGEVEMDAAIMDGKSLRAGAVSMVRQIKNPISLARKIMTDTHHVLLSGYGALEFAKSKNVPLEAEAYFITEQQLNEFKKKDQQKKHGTVGAVALDKQGNLASATSTGGISHCLPGRIGDSCIIGAGCYADNKTCAVSCTGEGEAIITGVIAHTIAMFLEFKKCSIQEACEFVIYPRNKKDGEIGVISVDPKGEVGICFNTEVMKRAWIVEGGEIQVGIYK